MGSLSKDSVEVANPASESTVSPSAATRPTSGLRQDALSLEIPVKVHGSRVTEVVRGVTPHTEPFEEQSSTMIIFPQGGVIRMSTAVNAGQMLVLTNSATKQDAICRVVKVRTFTNMQGYVEVEFTHPQPTYWGVTFPGSTKPEAAAPAKSAPQAPPKPAAQSPVQQEAKPKPASDVSWAPAMPASAAKPPAAELPKAPAIPPVPQKPLGAPSQPASSFIAIGSQEKVELPATGTTSRPAAPREVREAKREAFLAPPVPTASAPASPASVAPPSASSSTPAVPSPSEDSATAFHSLSMTELLGDSEVANAGAPTVQSPEPEPNAEQVSSAVPSSTFGSLSGGATLDASHASAPEAFGARFDSGAAEGSKGSPNWMLIAAAIGVLVVVVGGGAFYVRSQKSAGAPAAASVPVSASSPAAPAVNGAPAPASASPQFTLPAAPSTAPASAEIVAPHGNSVAAAPNKPGATSASLPAAARPSTAAVAAPAAPAPSRVTGNMVAESLNAHPVTAQRSTQDQDFQAPSVDAAPSADSASDGALPSILSSSSGPAAPEVKPEVKPEVPVKVGGNVREPRLTYSVQPVYPVIAKEAHIQGDVVVATTIDQKGNVVHMEVISGPPMLRGAAMAALKRWRYEPSQLNGEPIAVQMMVTLKFRM